MQDSDGGGLAVYWNRGANLGPPGGSRRPGFDPGHPLHAGLYQNRAISLLNMGNGLVCLNRPNLVATPGNTTIPTQVSTNIGPASGFTSASGGVTIATGFTTAVPTNYAYNYACIVQIASSVAFGSIFQVNTAFSEGFEIDSLSPAATVGTITEGPTNMGLAVGRYYFLAGSFAVAGGASGTSPGVNLLSLDLANGKLITAFTAFSRLTAAPTATWNFGGLGSSTTNGSGFNIHAIMASFTTMQVSTAAMALLANDPWGYWYPNNFDSIIAYSLRKPASVALPKNQYDWPLPTRQPRPDETHVSFYNPTQMNTGLKPAGADLTDLSATWTPPFRPDFTQVGFYNPTQMQTGLKPFLQTDWPVPLGARDPRQPERNWDWPSIATQRMQKPVGVQSWDLSLRQPPPRPDENWTFNYNPTQMNTGAKPAGAQSWDLSPRQVPVRPDETWTWNYNPTQMQTGQEPFFQTDWPVPTAKPRPDETWTWNYNPTYMQTGAKPFSQTDWPTPPPAFQFRRNWEWNYNPGQLNTGAKPLFQFDWQLPIAQPRLDANWTWPTFGGYFPVVSATPFAQYDWPLPIRSPLLVYGGNHPRLYGPGIQPFNQLDWPLPTPRFRPTSNWDWSTPALAFPFAFPHNQYDWPLPGRYPRPDETWVSFYNPTQMQTGAKPFFPIEWPLPVPRFRIDATWAWPTPQGYFPAAVAYPFNQYDWPLPGRAPRPMFGGFYDRGLTATPFPFNQYDWPLPTPPFRMDATWIWQTQHFAAVLPFNQYAWPLPVLQPQFFPYEFFANFVLGTPGNQPFAQYDWPLPRAPFRIEQTGAQFYNPSQMQTGTKPFAQTDWPVPLGARDPRQPDRTVAAFYNPTQMATGRKPFAQTEWPLPTPPNYGNLIHYTITGANNPNIYIPTPPSTVKIEWLIRARRRGRR